MTYTEIIEKVRKDIQDPDGNRWNDAEIIRYIDLGQRRISVVSLCLEGSLDYVGDSSKGAYALPDDFLEISDFQLPNGIQIKLMSSDSLNEDNTAKFLYDQTDQTPVAICLDFTSWNECRFYPSPTTGVAIGQLIYRRLPEAGVLEIQEFDALVNYSLFRMYVKEFDKFSTDKAAKYYRDFEKRERELKVTNKANYRRIVAGSFF